MGFTGKFSSSGQNRTCPRINCGHDAGGYLLHIDVGGGADASVSQNLLRVFHGSVALQIGSQGASHDLKGHQPSGDLTGFAAKNVGDEARQHLSQIDNALAASPRLSDLLARQLESVRTLLRANEVQSGRVE